MADSPVEKHRTISIGGATFDLFVRADRRCVFESKDGKTLNLPLGAKVPVEEVIEMCGGGASNTAVGLARLGCDAAFCGIVGSDQWGDKLLKNLQDQGVDTRLATVVDGETSSSSIILSVSSGERVILYNAGTNAHLHRVTFDREEAAQRDWIYLNHLHEDSLLIQDDLIEILHRDGHPLGLTWNPGDAQVRQGCDAVENRHLLSHTTFLLLNKEEALAFTRAETVEQAIRTILALGTHSVCVTDGGHGTLGADRDHLWRCPVIEDAPIIDTTGAGDAFGVGATWALVEGYDLPTALRTGTINATSVLGTLGAQAGLLTDIEMQHRLQNTQLDVEVVRSLS